MTLAFVVIALITCGLLFLCAREVGLRHAAQQVAAKLLALLNTPYRTPGDSINAKYRSSRR